jgi:hypothetical protein
MFGLDKTKENALSPAFLKRGRRPIIDEESPDLQVNESLDRTIHDDQLKIIPQSVREV